MKQPMTDLETVAWEKAYQERHMPFAEWLLLHWDTLQAALDKVAVDASNGRYVLERIGR